MTVGERIKSIRSELGLTMEIFGQRLGVTRGSISAIETEKRNPSDQLLRSICREFRVSEAYIRGETDEMFIPSPSSPLDQLAEETGLTDGERLLIEKFLQAKPEIRQGILDCILRVAEAVQSKQAEPKAETFGGRTREELHAELDRQLDSEKEEKASAS